MRRVLGLLLVVILGTSWVTACTPGLDDYDGPRYQRYVAIGDSYSAAPYVPTTDIAGGCLRSNHNYPSLVAEAIGVQRFTDVTCTGANTDQVWKEDKVTFLNTRVPKQINAVTRRTDLITVGIGFNNHHLFARVASICGRKPRLCNLYDRRQTLASWVADLPGPLTDTIEALKAKAPDARILIVAYPKIAPEVGRCSGLPRLEPKDLATLNAVNKGVVDVQKQVAKETKVEFVDFYNHSIGHDICSLVPWIKGIRTDRFRASAMHPLPLGQREAAAFVLRSLELPIPKGYSGSTTRLTVPSPAPGTDTPTGHAPQ